MHVEVVEVNIQHIKRSGAKAIQWEATRLSRLMLHYGLQASVCSHMHALSCIGHQVEVCLLASSSSWIASSIFKEDA